MAGLASQQALETATGSLLAQAAGWDDSTLSAVSSDVAAFAHVLRSEAGLRRVLTDATVAAEAKAALVGNLLSEKAHPHAVSLISAAVSDRWNSARDLREGLLGLSRTALFLQAERNNTLDTVEDELFRFGRTIDAHPELSLILDDPTSSAAGRAQLVTQLLGGRVAPLTAQLLIELTAVAGTNTYLDRVNELVTAAAARRNELVATVTTSVGLDQPQLDRLRSALGRIYSRNIALHIIVDPDIQGGLKVRVGNEVIDGSVSAQLMRLRQRLAG